MGKEAKPYRDPDLPKPFFDRFDAWFRAPWALGNCFTRECIFFGQVRKAGDNHFYCKDHFISYG